MTKMSKIFQYGARQRFPVRLLIIVAAFFLVVLLYASLSMHSQVGRHLGFTSLYASDGEGYGHLFPQHGHSYGPAIGDVSGVGKTHDPCGLIDIPGEGITLRPVKGTLVLVTGGAGFIGSNLVDRLLELGYRVRIFDNLYTGYLRNVPLHHDNLEFIFGDIMDEEALEIALRGVQFVFHLAAMSKVLPSLKNPAMARFCVETNALGTWNVLNAVRNEGNIGKVIYAASSTYYGNNAPPHQEDQAADFLTPYAASKYEGEIQMQMFNSLFNVPTISTRFFMVYGPRQPSSGAYAIVTGVFAKQAAEGRPLTIEGDGTHYRDFIHVDDIVTGLILAQQAPKLRGQTVNLGTGTKHSVRELADIVSPDQIHVDARKNDLEGTLADTCRMKRLLGYKPKSDFMENMKFMVQETIKGNAFMQSWLTTPLALSAPHLLPAGDPTFGWPKNPSDLDALLLALNHVEATSKNTTRNTSRRITILPLSSPYPDDHSVSELLLNTIFSLVRFGSMLSYLVAVLDDNALELCQRLNLPCLDARGQTHEQLINDVLLRGYDVHYAQYGSSYFKKIDYIFDSFTGMDALVANTEGDLFIRSNDETRNAFSSLAASSRSSKQAFFQSKFAIPDSLYLSVQPYQVQRLCDSHWAVKSANQAEASGQLDGLCSNDFYAAIGCSWDSTIQNPNATVAALKAAGLWHLTSCMDEDHCDLQQVVPRRWMQSPPDLLPYGDEC